MGNQARSDNLGLKVLTWISKVDIIIEVMIIDEHMRGKRNWLILLLSCHVVLVVLILLHHFHGSVHPVIQPAQQSADCSAKPLLCDSALSVISPGEMGVPGLRGPQGYQGPQGDTGKSGLKGSETPVDVFGDVGDPGKPGTSYCWGKNNTDPWGQFYIIHPQRAAPD